MKTKYNFITFLLCLVIAGCNDSFMEKYPEDGINDQNFWGTPDDLRLYANQFYPSLFDQAGGVRESIEEQSDNNGPATKNTYLWNEYTVPVSGGGWAKSDWLGIRRCNYFLERYHQAEGDQDQINEYLGEILMFKAIYYFTKVKNFGDVPWLAKDLTTSSEELYYPRDSRMTVIDSINACLDKSIAYLPEESSDNRVTKYAALLFKSRVNLYEGTFQKYHNDSNYESYLRLAATAAEQVINSGRFELYSTGNPEKDYQNLFITHDLSSINEAIFYTNYVADSKMHNRNRLIEEIRSGFTKDFAETFLCTDGLPISVSNLYQGDQEFMDEFENRDNRMKQLIYTPDQPYNITSTGEIEYESSPIFTNLAYTGYRIIKYHSPYAEDNIHNQGTIDHFIYRYAEALLNYAEAKAELGECDQTVLDISINKLRERAGMPYLLVNPVVDPRAVDYGYTISALLYEIRRERRIELAMEFLRWDDIVRWKAGTLVNNPKTYLGARDPETGEYRVLYPGFTRVWHDKLYLKPIPTDELSYNSNLLPQNPGW